VITMDMLGKVWRMKMRDTLSISQIAKRTGLTRNTIRVWLRAPGDVVPKCRSAQSGSCARWRDLGVGRRVRLVKIRGLARPPSGKQSEIPARSLATESK